MIGARWLTSKLSPAGPHARLSILIYHRVLPVPDPLFPGEVDAAWFDAQMALVKDSFNVLPLGEAAQRLTSGNLPPRAACITFDDGYADNAEIALPILERYGLPATFFVATDFLDGGRMWNDTLIEALRLAPAGSLDLRSIGLGDYPLRSWDERRSAIAAIIGALKYLPQTARAEQVQHVADIAGAALPTNLMMRSDQVRTLRARGMEIGGHTAGHPILARLDSAAARDEMARGKEVLEGILGERIKLFAYPNGKPHQDYAHEHVDMVRDLGFEAAVSTAWGVATRTSDVFQLPRFTPWDRAPAKFSLRLLQNLLRTTPQLS